MIGTTNAISDFGKQSHIYKYSHLTIWLDGSEEKNYAPTGSNIVMGSMNRSASRMSNQAPPSTSSAGRIPVYYQSNPAVWNGWYVADLRPSTEGLSWTNFTVTCWGYRLNDTTNSPMFYVMPIGGDSTYYNMLINFLFKSTTANNGFIRFTDAIGSNFAWNNDTWKFIACTASESAVIAYVNGSALVSATRTKTYPNSWTEFYIMNGSPDKSSGGGKGNVSDIRFYNYTMTASEILQLYNTGPQRHR